MQPDVLDPLAVHRYRFEIVLDRELRIRAPQRAILWRGAFGSTFRSLVCHDLQLDCGRCALRNVCPFPRVFAPTIPPDRPSIARLRDPPRPFVFGDPMPDAPALPAGQRLSLGLVLVGSAAIDLPYFVVALRKLGDEGLGRATNRFHVQAVRALDGAGFPAGLVYEHGSDLVKPERHPLRARDLSRPGDEKARRVRVRYLTATDVRGDAAPADTAAPSFGTLVRRARDRASALATFFGAGSFGCDARAVGASADRTELIASEVVRARVSRTSSRTGERHDVGGITGSAVYEGEGVADAMPWLRLAEVIGVGKHATFGQGRIAVDPLL